MTDLQGILFRPGMGKGQIVSHFPDLSMWVVWHGGIEFCVYFEHDSAQSHRFEHIDSYFSDYQPTHRIARDIAYNLLFDLTPQFYD